MEGLGWGFTAETLPSVCSAATTPPPLPVVGIAEPPGGGPPRPMNKPLHSLATQSPCLTLRVSLRVSCVPPQSRCCSRVRQQAFARRWRAIAPPELVRAPPCVARRSPLAVWRAPPPSRCAPQFPIQLALAKRGQRAVDTFQTTAAPSNQRIPAARPLCGRGKHASWHGRRSVRST